MNFKYEFTVFIPTYNRAKTLPRLLESLKIQNYKNFEVIVVDDGSVDNTKEIIMAFSETVNFPVRYYYQNNSGKARARNYALDLAEGKLFKTIDSDDYLMPNCLEVFKKHWDSIEEGGEKEICGIVALSKDHNTGDIIGDKFPVDMIDSNYVTMSWVHGIKGDKTNCISTAIFRKYKFPVRDGEKFIAESIIWNRLSTKYNFRFINEILKVTEYLPTGLSSNPIRLRYENPQGALLYYTDFICNINKVIKVPFTTLLRQYINYIRFAFHCKKSIKKQVYKEINIFIYIVLLPIGRFMYLRDRIKVKRS